MPDDDEHFLEDVGRRAALKLAAQRDDTPVVGLGLGMFGAVGWSVAIPTLLGALLGAWWDRHQPSSRSYTLIFLVAGLVLGCANAWRWVANANADIRSKSPRP
jgi:ATP synthase protein I